jgi:hypothetical protein
MNIRMLIRVLAIGIVGTMTASAMATAKTGEARGAHNAAKASAIAMASQPIHPTYEWRYYGGPKGAQWPSPVGQ